MTLTVRNSLECILMEADKITYTVKQLADLADVTPRTLRYYDHIGLLRPSSVGENGYRYYNDAAALRLQQILFYRELGLSLEEVQWVLDSPDFDLLAALQRHREALIQRVGRLNHLIATVDKTIMHLKGERAMSTEELFEGFDDETQALYGKKVSEMYDPEIVQQSSRRWKDYSANDRARVMAEGGEIYRELATMTAQDPASAEVQVVIGRWHQHIRAFYEPTPEIMRGLGQGYEVNPEFTSFFQALHSDLPRFLHQAIDRYVDSLPAAS